MARGNPYHVPAGQPTGGQFTSGPNTGGSRAGDSRHNRNASIPQNSAPGPQTKNVSAADQKVIERFAMKTETFGSPEVGYHLSFSDLKDVEKKVGKATVKTFLNSQKSYDVTDKGILYFKK